jgi:circadian clock protein KaiC
MSAIDHNAHKYIRQGLLRIEHLLPTSLSPEEVIFNLVKWCEELRIKRLVIDSISDLLSLAENEDVAHDLAYSLVKLMEERAVTTLMTYELKQVTGITSISEIGFSFIADTVIYIGFTEVESEVAKVISVLKLRGGIHQTDLRRLIVTEKGLKVGTKFTGLTGVLMGAPMGHYRETVDELLQPLTFVSDFIDMLAEGKFDEDAKRELLSNMKEQVLKVMRALCEKYEVDYEELLEGA